MNHPDQTPARVLNIDLDEDEFQASVTPGSTEKIIDEDGPVIQAGTEDPDIVDEDLDPADQLPKHAVLNGDGSVTLPLHYPKTIKSRKGGKIKERDYTELRFHRMTGADQRAIAAASDESSAVVSFARSTRVNEAVMNALFDKMDSSDINAGGQVLNNFLTSGRKTGRRS